MTLQTLTYVANGRELSFKMDLDPTFPADRWIIGADLNRLPYEPDVTAIMFRAIKEGDTVVDVGANVGYFTCLMAALVGPKGRVYAFEPGAKNFQKLERNVELNDFQNVEIIPKVLGNRVGEALLYLSADDSGGNALWDPALWWENTKSKAMSAAIGPQRQLAEITTLDIALEADIPTFIKIDTEGSEEEVLRGAQQILMNERPRVVAELSHFALSQMGSSEQMLRLWMDHFGYESFLPYHSGDLPKFVPPGTRIAFPHNVNLLFSTIDDVSRLWPEVCG